LPCISIISGETLHRQTQPSSISLQIGIRRVFSKKQTSIFYPGQKASHKKTTGLPTFRFLHHTFFDNSTSFCCKNLCLGALERYFIEQKSKNTKCNFFKNLKILQLNNNYMMYVFSKSHSGKKGPIIGQYSVLSKLLISE
jgi:hypothetical protein